MAKQTVQTYRYTKERSIIGHYQDEYLLTENEYYRLYSFFVTYSMCGSQSAKKRSFSDYGWNSYSETGPDGRNLKQELIHALNIFDSSNFVFTKDNDLGNLFASHHLEDGPFLDINTERAVIGVTLGDNNFLKLFHHIRNGFAHGLFNLRLSGRQEKMVIIEDHNANPNITARIVIKLATLILFINIIDRNGII